MRADRAGRYYIDVAILGATAIVMLLLWPILWAESTARSVSRTTIVQKLGFRPLFGPAAPAEAAVLVTEEGGPPAVREKLVAGYNKRLTTMILLAAITVGIEVIVKVVLIWGQGIWLNGADVASPFSVPFTAAVATYITGVYVGIYQPVRIATAIFAFLSFAILTGGSFFATPDAWWYWAASSGWWVILALFLFVSAVALPRGCVPVVIVLLLLILLAGQSVMWLLGPSALQLISLQLDSGCLMLGIDLLYVFEIVLIATYWRSYMWRKRKEGIKNL